MEARRRTLGPYLGGGSTSLCEEHHRESLLLLRLKRKSAREPAGIRAGHKSRM